MQSRDVLTQAATATNSATDRVARSMATADPAHAPLEAELRRFLADVRGSQTGTFEQPSRGFPAPDATETGGVEMPGEVDDQQPGLLRFLEPLATDAQEAPEVGAGSERSALRRAYELAESHAPELAGTRASMRVVSDGSRGTGSATELAMVTAVERAVAAYKADAADLTVRLQASDRAAAAHAQRVHQLELERSTAMKTAEYLETQRASLADELQQAWAAHERDEQARLALEAALSEAQASQVSERAAASEEVHRVERRLRELESAHTETLAVNAALRIELERLGARYDDACAAAEADRIALDARTQALAEATAESSRARDTLKSVLADLEDLSSWARVKSTRLAETLQQEGRTTVERPAAA